MFRNNCIYKLKSGLVSLGFVKPETLQFFKNRSDKYVSSVMTRITDSLQCLGRGEGCGGKGVRTEWILVVVFLQRPRFFIKQQKMLKRSNNLQWEWERHMKWKILPEKCVNQGVFHRGGKWCIIVLLALLFYFHSKRSGTRFGEQSSECKRICLLHKRKGVVFVGGKRMDRNVQVSV